MVDHHPPRQSFIFRPKTGMYSALWICQKCQVVHLFTETFLPCLTIQSLPGCWETRGPWGEKLLHAPDFGAVYAGKAESIGETLQTASP
jgi:hypothetical protein